MSVRVERQEREREKYKEMEDMVGDEGQPSTLEKIVGRWLRRR